MKRHFLTVLIVAVITPLAFAGTATMNFASNVGLLTSQSGSGTLTSSGGRASFSGTNTSMLFNSGALVSSGGTVSATMTLRPYSDAANNVGIVMESGGDSVQATCDSSGTVMLMDYIGNTRFAQFSYPNASNYFTLSYSASTGRATLTINGSTSVFLEDALEGAGSVHVGVGSGGAGGFASFAVTGPGIPDYPPADPDSDGDGVKDSVETAAGTDPHNPGNRPVGPSSTAINITAANGVTLSFPPNSVSSAINVNVTTPSSIPAGPVPEGKVLSGAAVELSPSGATFNSNVMVTLPYTSAQITGLRPVSLRPYVYQGGAYTTSGIGGAAGTPGQVRFSTSHFSLYVLAGDPIDSDADGTPDLTDAFPGNPNGQTDSDGDGLGDEWENLWFGDLTTADDTTNTDGDAVSDLDEFEQFWFNLDPTDGTSELPAPGALVVAAAMATIALHCMRKK